MKRDKNLRNLSSDHHQALALTRSIFTAIKNHKDDDLFIKQITDKFHNELLPHFKLEEQALLPELEKAGEHSLINRTLDEHAELNRLITDLQSHGNLFRFAELLKAHVKFEESILFETCQRQLDNNALTRIGRLCQG